MQQTILIAGATGMLGGKIINSLADYKPGKKSSADPQELSFSTPRIRAIVRAETPPNKIAALEAKGVEVIEADFRDKSSLAGLFDNVDCVVSALSGLADVIIDTQKIILDAAAASGVPRFIPSDFSLDFTNLEPGKNRNLDLRRSFHEYLDKAPIKATTIFNGAFMDLITADMPLILYKFKRILAWGDTSVKMDLTTMDDVADYTAHAAMDPETPRYLRIAGDSVNVKDVQNIMTDLTGKKHSIFKAGKISRLNTFIGMARFFSKNNTELYPAWQGMQYMRDMMEGKAVITSHDNGRYPDLSWTSVREFLLRKGMD